MFRFLPLLLALSGSPVAFAAPADDLAVAIEQGVVEVKTLGDQALLVRAHDRATALVEQARALPARAPARLNAEIALGNTLYMLTRFEEAESVLMAVFERTKEPETLEELLALIEVCSHLGATRHARGDLPDAMEWHQTAWMLLTENQIFHPVRFVVANQYADTAEEMANHELALMLRKWVVESLAHELGDDHVRVAVARIPLALGLMSGAADPTGALELLDRSRAVFEGAGETHLVAVTDQHRAQALLALERPLEARAALDAALPVFEKVYEHDPGQLVLLRSLEASLAHAQGRYQQALALSQAVLQMRIDALGAEHALVASAKRDVAFLLMELGRHAEAIETLEGVLAVQVRVLGPAHPEVATTRSALATAWTELGRHDDAVEALRSALGILEVDPGSKPRMPLLRLQYAYALHVAGRSSEAEEAYRRALVEAQQVFGPDHSDLGMVQSAYGALLIDLERLVEAEALLRRSLATLERVLGPNHPQLTGPLNNLAVVRDRQGDLVEAQELYERCLQISADVYGMDHIDAAAALHNLGKAHLSRGDTVTAKRLLEDSLARKRAVLGAEHPDLAVTLDALASIAAGDGDVEKAEQRARRALELRRASYGDEHPSLAYSYERLGQILTMAGRLEEAGTMYEQSLGVTAAVFGEDAERYRVAGPHAALAGLAAARGDHAGARERFEAVLERLPEDRGPEHPERLWLRREVALQQYILGEREVARRELGEVFDVEQRRVVELLGTLSDRERMAAVRLHRNLLQSLVLAHEGEGGDPEVAYEATLRFKGIVNRSMAVEQPARLATIEPAAFGRWQAVKSELAQLALAGGDAEELAALTAEKEALRRTLARAGKTERDAVAELGPRELCAEMPQDTALIDIVRRFHYHAEGDLWVDVYTAFVLSAGCRTVSRVELGAAGPVDEAIARHRALLASRASTSRVDRAGATVHRLLFEPLAGFLGEASTLYIVPDGPIATVPWAALPHDGGYLIEAFAFRVLDAAPDARARKGRAPAGPALVVGGVDYGPTAEGTVASRAACVSAFPPLPGTVTEAESVAARLRKAGKVIRLAGAEASEAAVREAVLDASIVHLATHGYFATGACRSALTAASGEDVVGLNPMLLSGVALAGANQDPAGIWTAEEIAGLPLNGVDLVVLSACETGLGETEDGQGVLGLQRAFALSGARAAVMSLWPVDDQATLGLMDGFYAALLRDKQRDELVALRQAQLELLQKNRDEVGEARPETWAAFVVAGSPRRTGR